MSNYLLQYREAIRSGEIIAGLDMIQELDNLIADLSDPQYAYNTHDAEIRISFIENCIKLTKAPFYGQPMILMLWEKAFIEVVYSFKVKSIDTGNWVDRFQEILLLITRKCGKTELIAALLLTELIIGDEGIDIVCSGMDDGTADLAYQAVDTMRLMIDPQSVDTWRNQKGIKCFIIRKPAEQPGCDAPENYKTVNSIRQLADALEADFALKLKTTCRLSIILAGIGMGSPENETVEVHNALLNADYAFGASRMLESVTTGAKKFPYYMAKDIVPVLSQIEAEESGAYNAVVLFSGDTGFYSGAANLYAELKVSGFGDVRILPGIPSLSYLAAKFNLSWQNARIISTHGVAKECWLESLRGAVCSGALVFFITSGAEDVQSIARELILLKKNDPKISDYIVQLGYQLSYADEKLYSLSLEGCLEITQKGLYSGFLVPSKKER